MPKLPGAHSRGTSARGQTSANGVLQRHTNSQMHTTAIPYSGINTQHPKRTLQRHLAAASAPKFLAPTAVAACSGRQDPSRETSRNLNTQGMAPKWPPMPTTTPAIAILLAQAAHALLRLCRFWGNPNPNGGDGQEKTRFRSSSHPRARMWKDHKSSPSRPTNSFPKLHIPIWDSAAIIAAICQRLLFWQQQILSFRIFFSFFISHPSLESLSIALFKGSCDPDPPAPSSSDVSQSESGAICCGSCCCCCWVPRNCQFFAKFVEKRFLYVRLAARLEDLALYSKEPGERMKAFLLQRLRRHRWRKSEVGLRIWRSSVMICSKPCSSNSSLFSISAPPEIMKFWNDS